MFLCCILLGCWDFNFLPTSGFSIKPLTVKLLAGEQKATEVLWRCSKRFLWCSYLVRASANREEFWKSYLGLCFKSWYSGKAWPQEHKPQGMPHPSYFDKSIFSIRTRCFRQATVTRGIYAKPRDKKPWSPTIDVSELLLTNWCGL